MTRSVKSSGPQFILMIGDEGVCFVPHKVPGAPAPFFTAANNGPGNKIVMATLARNPQMKLTIFADTLAQDFRRETLPRLNPLDRPKLIERRLKQAFPQAGLMGSLNMKHDRTQVLLAGMHDSGPVLDWLERLKEEFPELTPRIALLPLECADMVTRLLPEAAGEDGEGWALLLSRQRSGGFRQIVTHKGELIFTRLTPPLPPSAPAHEVAETIARDIKASLGYLGRLGLTDSAQLCAMLLMPATAHGAIRNAELPIQSYRLLTPHQAASDLDLPYMLREDEAFSDLLYAGWLAKKRQPRLALTPPDIKKTRQTHLIRQWGWRAAAASLLLAFGLTAWQASDLFTTLLDTRQEIVTLDTLKQHLSIIGVKGARMTEPLVRLRQAVERRRLFSEPSATPWAALQGLAGGIGDGARLVKLDWQSATPADESMQADVKLLLKKPTTLAEKRAIAQRYQKLAENVAQAMPGYDVRLARYPFPALPGEALSNEGAAKADKTTDDTAEIVVKKGAP